MKYTQHNPLPIPDIGPTEPIDVTMTSIFDWEYALERENLPDDSSKLTPLQKSRLERVAHQQGTIRTMWRDVAKLMGLGEETFDGTAEDAGEPPDDGDGPQTDT